ncbi:GRB2-associated-binding protein 1-like [Salvelinus namaycush]|uniref:GRB2-associated-binding protein 1-like n=1 Tax=Salvelinus namaycush TaxID=8040 RepID=A0A8U0PV51_SALNM|nr:GRB2-associated-binding protein 1-like [Salvelinus namaycush]
MTNNAAAGNGAGELIGEAWKRRWFVLRSGRLTGDPDVLEYYKHDHARKPIRIINMSLCEQVDAGLTFNKKDVDSSYVFDVRTVERVFYLVADSEEDMNTWVRCICDLCGFNPTERDRPTVTAHTPTVTTGHAPVFMATTVMAPPPYQPVSVKQLDSVNSEEDGTEYLWLSHCQSKTPHRPPVSSYHSTSSDTTDYNDNTLPSHWPPPSSSSSSSSPSSLAKDLPPHAHTAIGPWAVATETNPFSQSQDSVLTPELRRGWTRGHPSPHPRKHSLQLQAVSLPPICKDTVFNTGINSINTKSDSMNSNSNTTYQVPSSTPTASSPTPGQGDSSTPPPRPPKPLVSAPAEVSSLATLSTSLYRSASEPESSYGGGGGGRGGEGQGGRGERGNNPRAPRCNTIATSGYTHTGTGSQESYAVPRSLADQTRLSMSDQTRPNMSDQTRPNMSDQTRASMSDQTRASMSDQTRASMFEFSDSFNSYFMNKGMVPLGGMCPGKQDVDENYVPMNATDTSLVSLPPPSFPDPTSLVSLPPPSFPDPTSLISLPPPSFPDPTSLVSLPPPSFPDPTSQDSNYVTMTPCLGELPSLGRQVPPPAHLGFRSSPHKPHTRPSRRHTTGGGGGEGGGARATQPPPIHRNLKPRKGFSPISLHPKPLGLERTDSQTVGEFTRARRRKGKPTPLDITPLQEWEELPAPVRSPVTRTFTRDPSSCYTCPSYRPSTCQSSASSSDSDDPDANYVAMTTSNIALAVSTLRGDSPMVLRRPRGDKQVEYLDLDLHTGRVATPPRQKKSVLGGSMGSSEGERAREREGERARERVDYVVVDPERTRALKSTREAWHDGRQSTEKDK